MAKECFRCIRCKKPSEDERYPNVPCTHQHSLVFCFALYISWQKCQKHDFILCCTLSMGCSVEGSTWASKHPFTPSCIYPQWEHHFLGFFTSTTLEKLSAAVTATIWSFFLELWLQNSHLGVTSLGYLRKCTQKGVKNFRLMKTADLILCKNLTQFQRPWLSTTYQWW